MKIRKLRARRDQGDIMRYMALWQQAAETHSSRLQGDVCRRPSRVGVPHVAATVHSSRVTQSDLAPETRETAQTIAARGWG